MNLRESVRRPQRWGDIEIEYVPQKEVGIQ